MLSYDSTGNFVNPYPMFIALNDFVALINLLKFYGFGPFVLLLAVSTNTRKRLFFTIVLFSLLIFNSNIPRLSRK